MLKKYISNKKDNLIIDTGMDGDDHHEWISQDRTGSKDSEVGGRGI
jgi:hypothetical protein